MHMNRNTIIAGVVVLILIAGGIYLYANPMTDEQNTDTASTTTPGTNSGSQPAGTGSGQSSGQTTGTVGSYSFVGRVTGQAGTGGDHVLLVTDVSSNSRGALIVDVSDTTREPNYYKVGSLYQFTGQINGKNYEAATASAVQ
jgi:hypothetical protein